MRDNLTEIHLTDGSNPEILVEAISVDQDGNMLTRTNQLTNEVISYGWDDFDRLVRVSSAISGVPTSTVKESNRYDVNGIRKRKVDKSGNSSVEYTAGISTATSKAFGSSSAAPSISYLMGHQILGCEVNGDFRFHLMDAQGTVRDVVDDTGAVVKSFEFNEHGLEISSSGSGTFSPKTYQGGLSVNDDRNDSGLYLMGHRHFDSTLGRFISRDPIGFSGGLNLFNGAGVSPVTMVDPSGLQGTSTGEEWILWYNSLLREQARLKDLSKNDYNCHGYATGAPVHGPGSEDDFEIQANLRPSSRTLPRWNTLPLNELKLFYEPVSAPYQRGDTVLYGFDKNKNGSVLDDIYLMPDASGRPFPVLEAQHTAVVEKTDSKGNITECSSKPGQESSIWRHDLKDARIIKEYGEPKQVFRLKPGVNPNRVWRP